MPLRLFQINSKTTLKPVGKKLKEKAKIPIELSTPQILASASVSMIYQTIMMSKMIIMTILISLRILKGKRILLSKVALQPKKLDSKGGNPINQPIHMKIRPKVQSNVYRETPQTIIKIFILEIKTHIKHHNNYS